MTSLVLFDAGETLLGPQPSWEYHFVDVCGAAGVHVDEAAAGAIFRREIARFAARVRHTDARAFSIDESLSRRFWYSLYAETLSELGADAPPDLPPSIYARFTDFETYGFFEDAQDILEDVRTTGRRVGIVSNWESWLPDLIDHLGAADMLATVTVSGVVGVEKPDPEIYRIALDEAGVHASESAMVGDSLESDVIAPSRLGIRGILLDRHDRHPGVDVPRIRSLRELPELLGHH